MELRAAEVAGICKVGYKRGVSEIGMEVSLSLSLTPRCVCAGEDPLAYHAAHLDEALERTSRSRITLASGKRHSKPSLTNPLTGLRR